MPFSAIITKKVCLLLLFPAVIGPQAAASSRLTAAAGDTVAASPSATASDEAEVYERADRWSFELPFSSAKSEPFRFRIFPQRRNSGPRRYKSRMSGLQFGFVKGLGAPEADIDMSASCEIGIQFFTLKKYLSASRRHSLGLGFGMGWRNFRMTGRRRFVKDAAGSLVTAAYPEGADAQFSRIKTFSLDFPLRYVFCVSRQVSLSAAAILKINTYGSVKTRYTLDGRKRRDLDRHIRQRPATLDFQTEAAWRRLGVYVQYSPCRVVHKEFGPALTPLSAGVRLHW